MLTPPEQSTTPLMKAVANKGVVEKLARFGYLAHGAIYIIIGGLAAQFALMGEWNTDGSPWGAGYDPPSATGEAGSSVHCHRLGSICYLAFDTGRRRSG